MENPVDWTSVDLLVSQLTEMLDPQEDAEYVQEGLSTLKSNRELFHHAEETLRGLAKGTTCWSGMKRRPAE